MSQSARRPATLDDFFAIPEHERFHELYDGELHHKAAPTGEHGDAQSGVVSAVRGHWICEVLSPSNAKDDTVPKPRLYHQAGIAHYWIADPQEATLRIMRYSDDGYVTLQHPERHETIRAEPFQAIEVFVGSLFGDDPPET